MRIVVEIANMRLCYLSGVWQIGVVEEQEQCFVVVDVAVAVAVALVVLSVAVGYIAMATVVSFPPAMP